MTPDPRRDQLQALGLDPRTDPDTRMRALWVIGHDRGRRIQDELFTIANDATEPVSVRRVAAVTWFGADPARAVQRMREIDGPWPDSVVDATLTIMVDAGHHGDWRRWCSYIAETHPGLAPRVALLLGDVPETVLPMALVGRAELAPLGLPDPESVPWDQAWAAGAAWAATSGIADPFHSLAIRDAQQWAMRILPWRVAVARYLAVREWEAWLQSQLRMAFEPSPEADVYQVISLPLDEVVPMDEALARLIIGAFALNVPADPMQGQVVSNHLRSQAAALHLATAEAYQNAQITRWHVGAYTADLYLSLLPTANGSS
jgi:hypothetical protein